MAKDIRIVRSLTLGLTSVLAGMLIANMNKTKVEAKENTKSNSADETADLKHRARSIASVKKINKVVVESNSAPQNHDQDYEADPSLKMIGLNGIKNSKEK